MSDLALLGSTRYTITPAILSEGAVAAAGPANVGPLVTQGLGLSPGSPRFLLTQGFGLSSTAAGDPAKPLVLAEIALLSGIATPGSPTDRGGQLGAGNVAQQIMAANPVRTWLLLYNCGNGQLVVSTATAKFGAGPNIMIGPGDGLLWAAALGPVYQGAATVIGYAAGQPFYAWEA